MPPSSRPARLPRRSLTRPVLLAAVTVPLVALAASPAAAHVTVRSTDAAPGGYGKVVFRVPTESETASTTGVTVTLPAATPFASVSTKPHAGWTVSTTQKQLDEPVKVAGFTLSKAVRTVTWTAEQGGGLPPGSFDEFELSLGPFPKGGDLRFTVRQTYSDGTAVDWNQPASAGGEEPEHPAPTLTVAAAEDGGGSDTTARVLGGAGLAAGLLGLGLGVAAVTRRRPESAKMAA